MKRSKPKVGEGVTAPKKQRRIVRPAAAAAPPTPKAEESQELSAVLPSQDELGQLKQELLQHLAALGLKAVKALDNSLSTNAVSLPRNIGARSTDARYVLDVLLDRLPTAPEKPAADTADGAPVDELAQRRAALQAFVQAARRG